MKNILYFLLYSILATLLISCTTQSASRAEEVKLMPVFHNNFHIMCLAMPDFEKPGVSLHGLSIEERTEQAKSIIEAMGLEVSGINQDSFLMSLWTSGVLVSAEGMAVNIEETGFITMYFDGGFALPDGLTLSWEQQNEEAEIYLNELFAPILGVTPFAHEDEEIARLLNYHFNNIHFIPNFDGSIRILERHMPANYVLSNKIGYFPIITPEEAVRQTILGYGIISGLAPYEMPPPIEDYLLDIRLIYFGDNLGRNYLEVFAPWYQLTFRDHYFGFEDHHLTYFIPAIHSDYLEVNLAWGRFPHQ